MTAELEGDARLAPKGGVGASRKGNRRKAGQQAGERTTEKHALGSEERQQRGAALRRRHFIWGSSLTRRILLLNLLVLVIPVVGLMHLDQYRETLISAELESLSTQGRSFALSLGSTAVVVSGTGRERLIPEMTRHLMRVVLTDSAVRTRLFAPSGELIADSFRLGRLGDDMVQIFELPPADEGSLPGRVARFFDSLADWLPGPGDLPRYTEAAVQRADDYEEVQNALAGETQGKVRLGRQGRLIISVGVPVQRYRKVLGGLMLSKDGADVVAAVRDRRRDILLVFAVAFAATVLLSVYLAGTIARPIHRLARFAERVRHGQGRELEIPDFTRRGDEIGDLSKALREMTVALWNRLDAIEGFAADVAHEIKNPLTSLRSAVETVSRLEDADQQKKLMAIILDDVQRLDRLISDISDASRLDAELSRAESQPVDVGALLEALVEVHRSTETAGGPAFDLAVNRSQRLIVNGIEGRLSQVLRNLISNAASFSPPGGRIGLAARRERGRVEVTVSDQGPGLPPEKLEAVFERFYSERPRGEKFGTHSGLGLSISKQIVEAHGGTISAENLVDAEGQVTGARFVIKLPGA
ncbi:MAG: stimulus-sensing domain-containing protein [Kiloniellales bacterium]|nr:stimulus-sensing domain-containing protein [Kiloniellales bacterium]